MHWGQPNLAHSGGKRQSYPLSGVNSNPTPGGGFLILSETTGVGIPASILIVTKFSDVIPGLTRNPEDVASVLSFLNFRANRAGFACASIRYPIFNPNFQL